jgi:hypothetical protein
MTTIYSFLSTVFAFAFLYALIGALVPRLPIIRTRQRALIGAVGAFVILGASQSLYTDSLSPEEKAALALKKASEQQERDAKHAADQQEKEEVHAASRQAEDAKYKAAEIPAKMLVEIYTDNEISADSRFKGKGTQVTGTVDRIGKDIMDSPYITVGSGEEYEIRTVQCMLAKESVAAAANLTKGDRVTVRGNVRGLMMNVILKDCTIQ